MSESGRQKTWPQRCSVVKGSLFIFLPLFTLAVGMIAMVHFGQISPHLRAVRTGELHSTETEKQHAVTDIRLIASDLVFLSTNKKLSNLFQSDNLATPLAKAAVAEEFLRFSEASALYDQIRLLDDTGTEIVRVNFNEGAPRIVPEEKLQNKGNRYYFTDTFQLGEGQIFVSPLDLNVERGEIERPSEATVQEKSAYFDRIWHNTGNGTYAKPMIRFGTPVFDDQGRKRGIVLLNCFGGYLLNTLAQIEEAVAFYEENAEDISHAMLLNSDGYWLAGSEPTRNWAFMYDDRTHLTFGTTYAEAWQRIKSQDSGQFETADGLFTFASISPLLESQALGKDSSPTILPGKALIGAKQNNWKLVSHIPSSVLYARRNAWRLWSALFLGGSAVVLAVGSWRLAWLTTHRRHTEQQLQDYTATLEKNNQELEELNRVAQSANQAKSEFLTNMSHEIRTPMSAILGFSDILVGTVAEPEQIEAAKTIKRNGEYLLDIINDILDLSKIEAGKLEVERIQCSPCQVLSEVASLMRVRANAKNLPLELIYDGPIPESIQSDPTRLRQILINLAGNAIKFTEVGKIQLTARLLEAASDGPKLEFDMIDTGIGMTENQVAALFRPFQQADTSTTRKFGGTGLGLTISRRLARRLGGDIKVASIPGKGSTFTLTIDTGPLDGVRLLERPAEAHATRRYEEHRAVLDIPLDCRVLLAEDGPDNQRLITFLLENAGAEVTVAENGKVAFDKAMSAQEKDAPFDVILMDMQMPVMDGHEATAKLRAASYTGPIIALTADAMSTARDKCLSVGCDDYLTKPIDRETLILGVAEHAFPQRLQVTH